MIDGWLGDWKFQYLITPPLLEYHVIPKVGLTLSTSAVHVYPYPNTLDTMEKVQFQLEATLPELKDLHEKGLFAKVHSSIPPSR